MTVTQGGLSFGLNHLSGWTLAAAAVVVLITFGLLTRWLQRRLNRRDGQPPSSTNNAGCLVIFGGLFFLAGCVSLVLVTLWPMYRSFAADRWPTTQGHVLSSRLESKSSSKGGSSYRIDIRYRYTVDGKTLECDQYDGSISRSSMGGWREQRQAIVKAHPPGKTVTVHYNPADPSDAMLSTALPHGSLAFLWFPALFMGIGGAIMIASIRVAGRRGRPHQALAAGESAFDSRRGRRRAFGFLAFFALFWNGFVVFMFFTGAGWCMIPFGLIGFVIAGAAVSSFVALFNPTVAFEFDHMPLHAGERVNGRYRIDGKYLAVRELKIFLQGKENVSYREGTNTRTETHVAYHLPIVETTQTVDMEAGQLVFQIPAEAMTSFKAANNQFTWHLCVRGDIPGRPDIKDDFDVVVLPPKGSR